MRSLAPYFDFPESQIALLTDADVITLCAIINTAYSYQDAAKGEPRISPDKLRKRAAETNFYTVKRGGTIIGCVYLEGREAALHFGLLTVTPELRGTGLAGAMLNAIDQLASIEGYETIQLDYMSLAPWLRRYYERHGYQATGQVEAWGTIDLVRMSKPVLSR